MKRLLAMLGILFLLMSGGLLVAAPATVSAEDLLQAPCTTGEDTGSSSVCSDRAVTGNPISGTSGIINQVTTIIAIAAGTIAVIMIIVAGIRFATSHGDPQSVNNAKNTILYAVIGIVVILASRAIIVYIVNQIYG